MHLSRQSAVDSLFELVESNRAGLATEPRDMMYGSVGLVSDT